MSFLTELKRRNVVRMAGLYLVGAWLLVQVAGTVLPMFGALVYIGLGDKEEALHWLEQSYQDRAESDIGYIRVDPLLDPLRGDPRFEALAEKIVPAREFRAATK